VQKLKFLKINEASYDYKVMQSKIKKNVAIASDFFYSTIRTTKRALNHKILIPFGIKS
jgi:hypothetical protein